MLENFTNGGGGDYTLDYTLEKCTKNQAESEMPT